MNRSAPACNTLTTAQPGRCASSVRALRLQLEEPGTAHCAQEGGLPRPATVANRVRVDAVRVRDAQGTDTTKCAADHYPITHITVNHTGLSAEVRCSTVGWSSSTPPTKAASRDRVDTGRHGGDGRTGVAYTARVMFIEMYAGIFDLSQTPKHGRRRQSAGDSVCINISDKRSVREQPISQDHCSSLVFSHPSCRL